MLPNLKQGYPVKPCTQPTKRYCQQLDLVNDAALIEQYKYWHNPVNNWPEIAAGIRSVGILEMEIYLHKNHAFMIVEVPADFDWDAAFARLATLSRQAEWEAFVAKFQSARPDATSDEKWQLMERIYALSECR
jgi:L-rhamnose mutarotase